MTRGASFKRRFQIRIKPASEAAPTAPSSATDISKMLSSLRTSIEGPLPPTEPKPAGQANQGPDAHHQQQEEQKEDGGRRQQDSATHFQEGMKMVHARRWKEAIERFDGALGGLLGPQAQGNHWFVVLHHRVYASIMEECDALVSKHPCLLRDHPHPGKEDVVRIHRNLILCVRRLRLQSKLGIEVTIITAQSLMRTQEYRTAHALLQGILGVLPRYSTQFADCVLPNCQKMRDLCLVKMDEGVDTRENPFLAAIASHLAQTTRVPQVRALVEQVVNTARALD